MAIVKILGDYRGKKDKSNLDKFIVKKLNYNIDKEFSQEIFMENFLIEKTIAKNEPKSIIQQRLKKLEDIKKKYFTFSDSLENKITLLTCFTKLSNKYNSQLIDFIENNLEEILERYKLNWTISILNQIKRQDEGIVKYIVYLKELKSEMIKLDYGGAIPSYRDIQDSISIRGEYNFQKA